MPKITCTNCDSHSNSLSSWVGWTTQAFSKSTSTDSEECIEMRIICVFLIQSVINNFLLMRRKTVRPFRSKTLVHSLKTLFHLLPPFLYPRVCSLWQRLLQSTPGLSEGTSPSTNKDILQHFCSTWLNSGLHSGLPARGLHSDLAALQILAWKHLGGVFVSFFVCWCFSFFLKSSKVYSSKKFCLMFTYCKMKQ